MQVELYTKDIPQIFERFVNLVGEQSWRRRVNHLKSEIRGNRLLRNYLFEENKIAFCLQLANDGFKRHGCLDAGKLFPCMAFAAQIVSIAETLGETQKKQLIRRVQGALGNPDDMRGLLLELTVATHFLRRNLEVQWPEMNGGGTMDLIIPGLGGGLEIECKSVSKDKGQKIHKREVLDFSAIVAPRLNDLGKKLKSGISVVLTLKGRMPTRHVEKKKLAESVIRCVLSGKDCCRLDEGSLKISEFDLSLLGDLGMDGYPIFSRENVDEITETKNRQALIVGRKNGGAIVLVIQSVQDDSLLTYTFNVLARSAEKQFSGERAGMFLVGLEGIDASSLISLAQQDDVCGGAPTALRQRVSDFLASQKRDHVVGVNFISKGWFHSTPDGGVDSGGSAYVFLKEESSFWSSDFSGLFSER